MLHTDKFKNMESERFSDYFSPMPDKSKDTMYLPEETETR